MLFIKLDIRASSIPVTYIMLLFQQRNIYTYTVTVLVGFLLCFTSAAQCPPNIDFEKGDFSNWTAYTGTVSAATGQNVISLSTTGIVFGTGQHEMFSRVNNANDRDQFWRFPCCLSQWQRLFGKAG
jgi:hypothetical protein